MLTHFEKYRDKGGHYCFRLKKGNGEIVMVSEAYSSAAVRDREMDWVVEQFARIAREKISDMNPDGPEAAALPAQGVRVPSADPIYDAAVTASDFLDAVVSKAPEPLKKLGAWLADMLDEDDWPTAERLLNAAAIAAWNTRAEVDAKDAEIARLTQQNKDLGDLVHKRGNDLVRERRRNKKFRAEVARLTAKYHEAERRRREAAEQIIELEDNLDEFRGACADLEARGALNEKGDG